MVLIISDLAESQIYKLPHRASPHRIIEKTISFIYMNMSKLNEDKSLLFES